MSAEPAVGLVPIGGLAMRRRADEGHSSSEDEEAYELLEPTLANHFAAVAHAWRNVVHAVRETWRARVMRDHVVNRMRWSLSGTVIAAVQVIVWIQADIGWPMWADLSVALLIAFVLIGQVHRFVDALCDFIGRSNGRT